METYDDRLLMTWNNLPVMKRQIKNLDMLLVEMFWAQLTSQVSILHSWIHMLIPGGRYILENFWDSIVQIWR